MNFKIDSSISTILIVVAVLYVLLITDALGKIGIIINQFTYTTFQGIDAMFILFLIIAAILIYYYSRKKK